jgi:hypothetical protein
MPVEGEAPDPDVGFFLTLHNLCATYMTLPEEGGLFDQDSYLVHGLTCVINALAEKQEADMQKNKMPRVS